MSVIQAIAGPLSPDLVPQIFDATIALLLIKVVGVTFRVPAAQGLDEGVLTLQITEVFRDRGMKAGGEIKIPFRRIADPAERFLAQFDHWNALRIDVGTEMLVAVNCGVGSACEAISAENVPAAKSAAVDEFRSAVQLESFEGDSDRKEQLLEDAIIKGKNLLRRYALDAIGLHGVVSRVAGVQILDKAIRSQQTNPDEKVELAFRVLDPSLFQEDRHADRANRLVVSLLASGLANESDSDRRIDWTKYLASVLLRSFSDDATEGKGIKQSLIRPVGREVFERVRQILAEEALTGEEDTRKLASDVLSAWLLGK